MKNEAHRKVHEDALLIMDNLNKISIIQTHFQGGGFVLN